RLPARDRRAGTGLGGADRGTPRRGLSRARPARDRGCARAAGAGGGGPMSARRTRASKRRTRATGRAAAPAGGPPPARPARTQRMRRIGITCYSHFGGSGVVATELGLALARRGYEVHFIAHRLPFRLRTFEANVFFHEATPASYPVFEQAPTNLALATKMV